jgi:GT2 family glycosyltransferase
MGKYTPVLAYVCPSMELCVIIVSHNVKPYLEQCLYSLRKALPGIDASIRVVDNASSDDTVSWLKASFPEVHCMALGENVGFARANNLPLADITANYILFLNPDTLLEEDCLRQCLAFMNSHPDAGALGIRMVNGFGAFLRESKRGMPSAPSSVFKMSGLTDRFPTHPLLAGYYAGHLDERRTQPVPILSGAFMLVRGEVIRTTGSFDERFFMFGEDIDLSYRILLDGWKNYYFTGATLLHFKGQSTQKNSEAYRKHFFGAMTLYVDKYYRGAVGYAYRKVLQTGILLQKTKTRLRQPKEDHKAAEAVRGDWVIAGSVSDTRAFLDRFEPVGIRYTQTDLLETGFDGSSPVLFIIGDLTYSEVIGRIDRPGWTNPCYFHDIQSGTIVGPDKTWPIPFSTK